MRFAVAGLVCCLAAPSLLAADLRYPEDAAIRAVQFLDAKEGWAVGDEGVVWHSLDGGKLWQRLPTGTRASLRSLHFLSPNFGWVAGREETSTGSLGVLLFTRDGGLTWQRLLTGALPGLNQVRFTSDKVGFVVGDGTNQFGPGIFRTLDGGQHWEPIQGPSSPGWLVADFQDGKNGIFAGAWGRLGWLRDNQQGVGQRDDLGGRSLLGLALLPKRAIAVGQGGLILTSASGGLNWGFADLKLPPEVARDLDFQAISSVGSKVWVAGRPGSFLLTSDDQGSSWKLQQTGQPMPIHGLFFHDEKTGWAVGDLGTILRTTDGGKSWSVERQGGKRAAMLFLNASARDVPLDALARLGADDGYLVTALRVLAPDGATAPPSRANEPQRFSAAIRLAGGAVGETLWQFPVPEHIALTASKEVLVAHFNAQQENQAQREMLRQLVLTLRLWKPDVVVVDHPDARASKNAAGALVSEALHEAINQADDPKAFPEQLNQLGLSIWRVKKVYAVWDTKAGEILTDNNQNLPRLEASVRDFADAAGRILGSAAIPDARSYRLLETTIKGAAGQGHFLDGFSVTIGEARRPMLAELDPKAEAHAELAQALQARRNLMVMAEKLDDPDRTLGQIVPMLKNLSDDQAAATLFKIADMYSRRGQWPLARETFLMMVDRYPSHPLSVDAYRWLIRHISSSEARRRHELGQFYMVNNLGFNVVAAPAKAKAKEKEQEPSPIIQAAAVEPVQSTRITYLSNLEESRLWYRGSLEFAKRLAGFGPLYSSDPAIQFPIQSAKQRLGDLQGAKQWFALFRELGPKGPWQAAAAAELWLMDRSQPQPPRLALCRRTEEKPFLDGDLSEACWHGISPMTLDSAAGDTAKTHPTEAFFAFDNEFLYVAVRCKHPAGESLPSVKERGHDADLDPFDRVSILLDLDRDYSTYFRLEIDQRGCVREDCWGDKTWNPRWFVASKSDDNGWTAEAAIPLAELTGDRIATGAAWTCNVIRTLPGRGIQAWSLPAAAEPRPEGMSLLIFQEEARKKN